MLPKARSVAVGSEVLMRSHVGPNHRIRAGAASVGRNPLPPMDLESLAACTRDFPEIITSTGAKFSCNFCLSVLVLVIFQAPNNGPACPTKSNPNVQFGAAGTARAETKYFSRNLDLDFPSLGSQHPSPNAKPLKLRNANLARNHRRGRKRHINIWHINNFSVTPITDPSGREPDSSQPGTRTKTFMFLGFRTQHINFWPLATGRETPPPPHPVGRPPPRPGNHRKNLFMFMCLFLSWWYRKPFSCLFSWGIAQVSRDMLQNGVSHWYVCVKQGPRGGGIAPCWGIAGMADKVSRDREYRSDTIALSRDMEPLRSEVL